MIEQVEDVVDSLATNTDLLSADAAELLLSVHFDLQSFEHLDMHYVPRNSYSAHNLAKWASICNM